MVYNTFSIEVEVMTNSVSLNQFFPKNFLELTDVIDKPDKVVIHLKSITRECKCPGCGNVTTKRHGTYTRKVQDFPILGKNVQLQVMVREYDCENEECPIKTVTESFDGFLSPYARMTQRCVDFVCMLALETSCEGAARICQSMNLKISGDTIIRMLQRQYELQEKPICSAVVGVDDFAFKKRHTYGTIIVDGETHKTVAILKGRNGETLKEWLRDNKHVKIVTRDRASAYASAIEEILPDAMQIADRFHLHQNLLEAIRSVVNSTLPVNIKIPKDVEKQENEVHKAESVNVERKKNG
jgi:transposase